MNLLYLHLYQMIRKKKNIHAIKKSKSAPDNDVKTFGLLLEKQDIFLERMMLKNLIEKIILNKLLECINLNLNPRIYQKRIERIGQ